MKESINKIIMMNPSDLIPYNKNARIHDVDKIANSIREFGFKDVILIDEHNVIINGHGRHKASLKLGLKQVPVAIAKDLSDEEIKALRLADNKTAECTEWDNILLAEELASLGDIDMSQFGFEEIKKTEEEKEIIEVEVPTANIPKRAKRGDVWKLGNHRLMCENCTSTKNLKKIMDGMQADLLITDPPYNVNYEGSNGLKIQNDNMEDLEFRHFLVDAFKSANEVMKLGAVFYIWHADSEGYNFRGACHDINWNVRQCLIWNKNSLVLGRQDYHWKHEPCLYGWKDGASHYFIDDRSQTTVIEDKKDDFKKMPKAELVKLLEEIYAQKLSTTVIDCEKPSRNAEHPTMKPIKLIAQQIKNSSKTNQLVLDLFGGSGTTLIACEQLNRKCYMMELDEHYCDVILQRWENLTGQKAERING